MIWLRIGKPSGVTNSFICFLTLTLITPNQNLLETDLSPIQPQRMPMEIPSQNGFTWSIIWLEVLDFGFFKLPFSVVFMRSMHRQLNFFFGKCSISHG